MRKSSAWIACCALIVPVAALGAAVLQDDAKDAKKAKHAIKQVMKEAHKDGLLKVVSEGTASDEDKAKLLDLYVSLWDNIPPKGESASWNAKAGALIVAASKIVLDREDGLESLKKAANCAECHKEHKG